MTSKQFATHLFRIDKFAGPATTREAFLARLHRTHSILGAQPGCVQNRVLELAGGPSGFNFVTMVEWESRAAVEAAKAVIQAQYAAEGFDPDLFRLEHGIRADIGQYRERTV